MPQRFAALVDRLRSYARFFGCAAVPIDDTCLDMPLAPVLGVAARPRWVSQTDEVLGFLLELDHGPRICLSGDTVMFPELRTTLAAIDRERSVDLAVVHCGAVRFPRVPLLSRARFTFDAAEAIEACRLLEAKRIVPIHRMGWTHFQEPEKSCSPPSTPPICPSTAWTWARP